MHEQLRMYLFDLDGTLIDSSDGILKAVIQARELLGYGVGDQNWIKNQIGLPVNALFSDLNLSLRVENVLIEHFRNFLRDEIVREVILFDGVTELLDVLSAGLYEIGIATSKPQELSEFSVQNSELANYKINISGTIPARPKPHPDVILNCMPDYQNTSALMIGDRCEDVIAALAAGIPAVGIAQSAHSKEELLNSGAKLVFDRFRDLIINFDMLEKVRSQGL